MAETETGLRPPALSVAAVCLRRAKVHVQWALTNGRRGIATIADGRAWVDAVRIAEEFFLAAADQCHEALADLQRCESAPATTETPREESADHA